MIRLASASISRAKILKDFGVDFIQKSCDFDEDTIVASTPKEFVYLATLGKYHACKKEFGIEIPLLVADTVVTAHGKILRKAQDREDAQRILELQSGSISSIITCMIYESKSLYFLDIATTDYIFETFDEEDLKAYLDSDEWMGKAGACMVEGFCKKYIKEVRGLESTAMGLGIERLLPYV
ncbi:MAG TPA: septum formation inhibitor Maf [Campylobacterales bacterium]|nr:septum formation inhibitor Maf [Campylobacterales bacterium]HIP60379.1 septum formation inhibitor Maf [Campylobacterales bacterium]